MLKTEITKNIKGHSMIGDIEVISMNANIFDQTDKPYINTDILDAKIFSANAEECSKDISDFVEYVESCI